MGKDQRIKVTSDIKKNRIYVTMPTVATKKEMGKIYTEIRFCVVDLQPGFDVVNDLSSCNIVYLDSLNIYKKIIAYLVSYKVGRIIRVSTTRSLALKQALAFADNFNSFKPINVDSMEDAEEVLRQPADQEKLSFQLHSRKVQYSSEQTEEEGQLVDFSLHGCAVAGETSMLAEQQEVTLSLPLNQEGDRLTTFTFLAQVDNITDQQFTANFLDLDAERKEELHKCLVNEIRKENT